MIHFRTFTAALAYYKPMGFTATDVKRKLREFEIRLGPPAIRPGQSLTIDSDGRYILREVA